MNTIYLPIIAILCISVTVLTIPQAHGVPYVSPPGKYFNSDIVLIGKVISSTSFSPTYTKYEIQVEQYLKNPQPQDTMTVIAPGTNKTRFAMTADTIFDVGQRAFLYLKKDQGNNVVRWYSYPTESLCDPAPTAADMNSTHAKDAGLDYDQLHTGASKSNSYLYAPNQPVIISYNAWNNQFTRKTFDVVFQVKNQTGQILFNDTKQVELKPCMGHQIVNSTFVPKVAGTYEVDVIFDNSLTGTTVEIPSLVGTSSGIAHASPLKQFKTGVAATDVTCRKGLSLIFKTVDNSPACVKLTSIQRLVSLHWALKPIDKLTVEEFKDTYKTGEKIDFVMKFKGFHACGYPSSLVKNAENKTIWQSPIEITLCDPDTGYGEYQWRFGELYNVVLNQTGTYRLDISFSNTTLEKEFEVK